MVFEFSHHGLTPGTFPHQWVLPFHTHHTRVIWVSWGLILIATHHGFVGLQCRLSPKPQVVICLECIVVIGRFLYSPLPRWVICYFYYWNSRSPYLHFQSLVKEAVWDGGEHAGEQVLWLGTEMSWMQKPQTLWIYDVLSDSHTDVYIWIWEELRSQTPLSNPSLSPLSLVGRA